MCTAVTYKTKDSYFGRNLDLEFSYGECVSIMPRMFPFPLRHKNPMTAHHAIIGISHVADGYPLYYDAANEFGLGMAALRFTDSSPYADSDGITSFELIPFVLGQCISVNEAKNLLTNTVITNDNFSSEYPNTPLHWMIADKNCSIVVEWTDGHLKIFDNPIGVLTNTPSFDRQLINLDHTSSVPYGISSEERFARAVYVRKNSISDSSEEESTNQFFHILDSVSQIRGLNITDDGSYEITVYSSCMNLERGIYYYKTYENSRITAVNMHNEDLNGSNLLVYPLNTAQDIHWVN